MVFVMPIRRCTRPRRPGGNRVAEFHPRLLDERLRRARMTTELRHAVSRKELMLHYQPIVGLEDGEVVGVEALARWQTGGRRDGRAVRVHLAGRADGSDHRPREVGSSPSVS